MVGTFSVSLDRDAGFRVGILDFLHARLELVLEELYTATIRLFRGGYFG